jgi:protoporphyrinogen oxidase
MPQYRPGQAKWIAGIQSRSQRHPGLFFAGSTLGAFGLPDCTQSGEDAARAAFEFLSTATAGAYAGNSAPVPDLTQ